MNILIAGTLAFAMAGFSYAQAVPPPEVSETPAAVIPGNGTTQGGNNAELNAGINKVLPGNTPPAKAKDTGFPAGKKYTVREGDTLWSLSSRYYSDPLKWSRIYDANQGTIKKPERIYPGEELVIPGTSEEAAPPRRPARTVKAARKHPLPKIVFFAAAPEPEAADPAGPVAPAPEAGVPAAEAPVPAAETTLPEPEAPVPGTAAVPEAVIEENTRAKDRTLVYDRTDLSEEMPEHLKEWSDKVLVVPDNWSEDGTITGKDDEEAYTESLTQVNDVVIIALKHGTRTSPGDTFDTYMLGSSAFDRNGKKLGKELSPTGTVKILSVRGGRARARITRANTSVDSGQVVKKQ